MRRSAVINFVLVILVVMAGWFGAWQWYQAGEEKQRSIDLLEDALLAEQRALERLAELERFLTERSADIEKLEIAIPKKRDSASAVAAFEEAANTNGLTLNHLSVVDTAAAEPVFIVSDDGSLTDSSQTAAPAFKTYNIELEMEGKYASLQSFFDAIESSFPLMDVLDVAIEHNIESDEVLSADPVLKTTLSVDLYYLGEAVQN